ncbi:hypothetical protein [Tateyamaria sp. ANG-S1]|uniref:hypothetical protein n=1 Tax=Tateyamaria sp. ANG-S1 TaxID=1577905 RepID=UPI00057CA28D|nr:hypothetical protein [Tateyamaria sp. ANG-S1]KIC48482.1 hypothetical protein RA29_12100 [Tateyamaria sp. ANG-S1]
MSDLCLIGYRYSAYTRAARMGLQLAECDYAYEEFDPFDADTAPSSAHPMIDAYRRVPAGAAALAKRPALSAWFEAVKSTRAFTETAQGAFPEAA